MVFACVKFKKLFHWHHFYLVFLLVIFFISEPILSQSKSKANLADHFYKIGEYQLARIEYERDYIYNKKRDPYLLSKIGLSLIRQNKFKKAVSYLNKDDSFLSQYLRLYATLRQKRIRIAAYLHSKIEKNPKFKDSQKFHSRLLAGSIFLEKGEIDKTITYFEKIKFKSKDKKVIDIADQVLVSLNDYSKLDNKSAILAGVFSSILPGSGQMYTEHYVDGAVALFFNTMFLGSAIVLYDLENQADRPHQASIIAGIFGISFYLSNILGAYKSAHRYNIYQKRKLFQDIRMYYFNTNFIESSSQIKFTEKF